MLVNILSKYNQLKLRTPEAVQGQQLFTCYPRNQVRVKSLTKELFNDMLQMLCLYYIADILKLQNHIFLGKIEKKETILKQRSTNLNLLIYKTIKKTHVCMIAFHLIFPL